MTITFTAEVFEPNLNIKKEVHIRCSKICKWAQKRYTKNGVLVISIGGKPSPFSLIEQMVWDKYIMGKTK
jgi:hypothetical protein